MNDFLVHYGIKGQKWDIRRFQNEDGTLTEEGKQRYGVGDGRSIRGNDKPYHPPGAVVLDEYRNMGPKPHEMYRPRNKDNSNKKRSTAGTVLSAIGATVLGIGALKGLAGGSALKQLGAERSVRYLNTAFTIAKGSGAVLLGKRFMAGIRGNDNDDRDRKD